MKYLSSLLIFISYVAVPRWCNNCAHFIPCPVGEEFGQCSMFPIAKKGDFFVTGKKKTNNTGVQLLFDCSNVQSYVR